jgi:hypothetical protein
LLQESTSFHLPATNNVQQPPIDSGSLSGIRALVVDDQPDNSVFKPISPNPSI